MKAVLQRVREAVVRVGEEELGRIGAGVLVLLGVEAGDTDAERRWLVEKIAALRIFPDAAGKMNVSLAEHGGGCLLVSQFTLLADCRKGTRPSFAAAAAPEVARRHYEAALVELHQRLPGAVASGRFAADMQVHLLNDGPVTIVLERRPLPTD